MDSPNGRRVELARQPAFELGGARVNPAACEVVHADVAVRLQPRVMQVLVALARADGEVVSRDDLVADCWGGLAVSEDSINRCIQRLRRLAQEEAPGSFSIETLARIGYRLSRPQDEKSGVSPATSSLFGKPSIAVLPFANLSGDGAQDYFVDGLMEEIVTSLTRIRSLFVIASGSSLALKGQNLDPLDAARKMGVRYVLEGSVRRVADRVRTAVHLVDASIGAQIWAERFDDNLEDVFELQDRVALGVAGAVEFSVQHAETLRLIKRPTQDVRGYDGYLRAVLLFRTYRRDDIFQALELLDQAIELDPGYGLALSLAACCHALILRFGWADDSASHRRLFDERAADSVRVCPDDPQVLASTAQAYWAHGRIAEAAPLADRAAALNPGSSLPLLARGQIKVAMGDLDTAEACLLQSMRLDPLSPNRNLQLGALTAVRYAQGRFAEAADLAEEWTQISNQPTAFGFLAASHGKLRRTAEARKAMTRLRALSPISAQDMAAVIYQQAPQRQLLVEGLTSFEMEDTADPHPRKKTMTSLPGSA
ncbi:MAG: winged helix-turn-helix domain-containing tetratricopeptide repeat protein [Caulobacteraceae bacterium]